MRILEVRFKNLNSLAGEWVIDFTNPAYTADGIFAITGPTGAGKTTILDAICLALYGRTPRLDKISKNDNEIMSRHTGECFAEVSFETRTGCFRSHWSQHRARRKPGGELQNPQHEIVNANTNQVLESKIRDVALLIEKVTGMDFGRFTRSMLLAQGGFAAFLQAQPDERAPILEQITGAEIYSKISMKVHERRGEERRKLENLQAELAGIQLLSQEEEQELVSVLQEKLVQIAELGEQIDSLTQSLAWLEGIAGLQEEIVHLGEEWQGFQERKQLFIPALKSLNRAHKALAVEGDYQKVMALRVQQQQETSQLAEAKRDLPNREAEVQEALNLKQAITKEADRAKALQKSESENIKLVREMDLRLADKHREMEKTKKNRAQIDELYDKCQQGMAVIKDALQQSDETLNNIAAYLQEHAVDIGLVENFAAISQLFNILQEKAMSYQEKCTELAGASDVRDLIQSSCKEMAAAHENSRSLVAAAEQEHQQLVAQIETLLEGRELNEWRQDLDALKEQNSLLEQSQSSIELISITRQNLDRLREQQESLKDQQSKYIDEIEFVKGEKGRCDREIDHLEKELTLLNRINSLEEERKRLEDGQACPLCGATEHPYAEGNIPALDESELALKQVRGELKSITGLLLDLQLKQGELNKDIGQIGLDIKKQQDILDSEEKKYQEVLARLNIEALVLELPGQARSKLTASRQKIAQYNMVITEALQKEKMEKSARKAIDEARKAYTEAEKSLQEARYQQKTAEQEYARRLKERTAGEEELIRVRQQAWQEVKRYGVDELPLKDLDRILEKLKQRRGRWQEIQLEKASQEKKRVELKIEWGKQETQITKLEEEVQKWSREYKHMQKDYNTLQRQRLDLYRDKNPDSEENKLQEAVEQAEKNLENARREQGRVEQELSNLQVRIASLSDSLLQRARELIAGEEELMVRLTRAGFLDEADYRSAILGEEEREQLEKEVQLLRREESELETRLQDRKSRLNTEQEKMLSDESYEKLKENLASANSRRNDLQQEIYALKHSLTENQKRHTGQQEQLKMVAAQKKECERWDILHNLIGSADGKKYRNFAQGLTFDVLVAHANRQLQKMSDRYLLLRNRDQPLELNVIDNYQGGEIRSTKNLSGGESFIVSLALALGLSQMASRNVNIDSLFLDEGFGTLDEDVLDSALETLAGLQQEGKMIGIISHVNALKERISTQIEVIPKSGGYSQLSGPGCTKIEN